MFAERGVPIMSERDHSRDVARDQDRINELETTVAELQSTVKGLTEELVETKDRLRTIETEFGVNAAEVAETEAAAGVEETPDESGDQTETDMVENAESTDDEEHIDDIIVA